MDRSSRESEGLILGFIEPDGLLRSLQSRTRGGEASSPITSPESRSTRTYAKLRRAGENDPSPESWAETSVAPTVDSAGHGPRTATLVLTSSAEASPAKTFPSPDAEQDSQESAPASSTSSPASPSLFDPDSFSSRTYPVSSRLAAVRDAAAAERFSAGIAVEAAQELARALRSISWGTSPKWRELCALAAERPERSSTGMSEPTSPWSAPSCANSGTESPSGFSTAVSSECRSDEGGCSSSEPSLSEILEEPQNVPAKYSLSARAASGILRRAEKRGRTLPEHLAAALESVAGHRTPSA